MSKQGLNILVTGGAGFKGVMLVESLLKRGCRVTVLDNFESGYQSLLHLVHHPNLRVVQADICNTTPASTAGYDVVFHLAGIVGLAACSSNPRAAHEVNTRATERLVEGLRDEQLLIFASTTSIYGAATSVCDETWPVDPKSISSVYSKTKYEAEGVVLKRGNSIVLRFATVFGVSPRMRMLLLVNEFVYRAINDRAIVVFDGHSKRTFMHIRDAVESYLFALDHADKMRGEIFNVGHERLNLSKLEIAECIRKHQPCEIIQSSQPDIDHRNFTISFDKIQRIGFVPQFSLDDGVRDLVKLFRYYKCGPSM